MVINVYAVCATETGDASFFEESIPVVLSNCHRPTTTTRLISRAPRKRRTAPGGVGVTGGLTPHVALESTDVSRDFESTDTATSFRR